MTFAVRKIDASTVWQAERIFRLRHQVGKEQLTEEQLTERISQFEAAASNPNKDPRSLMWGVFTGDVMAAYMCQEFSVAPNHWLMSFLATNPELGHSWNYLHNGLDELWARAFQEGRKYGRSSVVWSLPVKWAATTERTQKSSRVWPRYTICEFARVPAGEVPTNSFDRWVAGGRPKDYDVVLRAAWLKADQAHHQLATIRTISQRSALPGQRAA